MEEAALGAGNSGDSGNQVKDTTNQQSAKQGTERPHQAQATWGMLSMDNLKTIIKLTTN